MPFLAQQWSLSLQALLILVDNDAVEAESRIAVNEEKTIDYSNTDCDGERVDRIGRAHTQVGRVCLYLD